MKLAISHLLIGSFPPSHEKVALSILFLLAVRRNDSCCVLFSCVIPPPFDPLLWTKYEVHFVTHMGTMLAAPFPLEPMKGC